MVGWIVKTFFSGIIAEAAAWTFNAFVEPIIPPGVGAAVGATAAQFLGGSDEE